MFQDSKKYSPAAQHYLDFGFYTDAIPGTRSTMTTGMNKENDACRDI